MGVSGSDTAALSRTIRPLSKYTESIKSGVNDRIMRYTDAN